MPIIKTAQKTFLLVTVLSLVPGLATAKSNMSSQDKYQLLLQIRQTKIEIDKADLAMIVNLNKVLKRLKSFVGNKSNSRRGIGILPTEEIENLNLSNYLSKEIYKNPYKRVLQNQGENTSKTPTNKVIVKLDASLSPSILSQYRQKPPKTWIEKPGTIVVLHNGYNFAMLWAAGVKGAPVLEKGIERAKIKSLKLNL